MYICVCVCVYTHTRNTHTRTRARYVNVRTYAAPRRAAPTYLIRLPSAYAAYLPVILFYFCSVGYRVRRTANGNRTGPAELACDADADAAFD